MGMIVIALNNVIDWIENFKKRISDIETAMKNNTSAVIMTEEEISQLKAKIEMLSTVKDQTATVVQEIVEASKI